MRGFQHPSGMPAVLDQNQQDYATQIARAVALQSKPPGQLDPRIALGITVDDWTLPEFWTLRRGTRWQAMRSPGAVAGQRGFVQATGSPGTLSVLERVWIYNNSGATLTFNYGMWAIEAAAGGGGGAVLDDRYYSAASPGTLITWSTAVAPGSPNSGSILTLTGTMTEVPLNGGIVLTGKPNTAGVVPAWKLVANQVNLAFDVMFFYRERPILDTER